MIEKLYGEKGNEIGTVKFEGTQITEVILEGHYWHHHFWLTSNEHVIKQKEGGEKIKEPDMSPPSDTYPDGEKTKDLFEGAVAIMVDLADRNSNVITWIYDSNGDKIGGFEEGLDAFLQLTLEVNMQFLKIWFYPEDGIQYKFDTKYPIEFNQQEATPCQKLYDKDKHLIGKLEIAKDEQEGKICMLTINGKYRFYFVSALSEWIREGKCGFTAMERQGEYPKLEDNEDEIREQILEANVEAIHGNVGLIAEMVRDSSEEGSRAKELGQGILDSVTSRPITTNDPWSSMARKHKNVWTELYNSEGENIGEMEEGMDEFLQVIISSDPLDTYFKCWHYPPDEEDSDTKNKIIVASISENRD